MLEKILVSKKEFSDIDFERVRNALVQIKKSPFDSDDNMYLNVHSLRNMNTIITVSSNIILGKVNVKYWGYDKMYMDKHLIEEKPYQLVDQFNERKINHRDFYSALLDKIHPFHCVKSVSPYSG